MDSEGQAFRRGMIILWSGAIADIPGGWALCNGSNGTPNLENVFLVGAGDTYVVGATGGAANHNHGLTSSNHGHMIVSGSDIAAGTDFAAGTTGPQPNLTVDSGDGRPPYYALAYIMKL